MLKLITNRLKFVSAIFCCCALIVLSFSFVPLADSKNEIQWNADQPLTWDDFLGSQSANGKFAALTSSNIHYDFEEGTDSLKINVYCYFDKKQSKVKKHDRGNALLLRHEQYHFNIAELFTRKLRKELSEKIFTKDNYRNEYVKLQNTYVKKCNAEQDKYDNESQHSLKTEKQLAWEKKVDDELAELKDYSWNSIKRPFK